MPAIYSVIARSAARCHAHACVGMRSRNKYVLWAELLLKIYFFCLFCDACDICVNFCKHLRFLCGAL